MTWIKTVPPEVSEALRRAIDAQKVVRRSTTIQWTKT